MESFVSPSTSHFTWGNFPFQYCVFVPEEPFLMLVTVVQLECIIQVNIALVLVENKISVTFCPSLIEVLWKSAERSAKN